MLLKVTSEAFYSVLLRSICPYFVWECSSQSCDYQPLKFTLTLGAMVAIRMMPCHDNTILA